MTISNSNWNKSTREKYQGAGFLESGNDHIRVMGSLVRKNSFQVTFNRFLISFLMLSDVEIADVRML